MSTRADAMLIEAGARLLLGAIGRSYLDRWLRMWERPITIMTLNPIPYPVRALGIHTWPVSRDEIKSAYKRLALVHHPDRGGDPSAFMALENAYRAALAALT